MGKALPQQVVRGRWLVGGRQAAWSHPAPSAEVSVGQDCRGPLAMAAGVQWRRELSQSAGTQAAGGPPAVFFSMGYAMAQGVPLGNGSGFGVSCGGGGGGVRRGHTWVCRGARSGDVCSLSDSSPGCWLVSRALEPEMCAYVEQCGAEIKVQVHVEPPGPWGPGCAWSWRWGLAALFQG